jgi:hypothetical protein
MNEVRGCIAEADRLESDCWGSGTKAGQASGGTDDACRMARAHAFAGAHPRFSHMLPHTVLHRQPVRWIEALVVKQPIFLRHASVYCLSLINIHSQPDLFSSP